MKYGVNLTGQKQWQTEMGGHKHLLKTCHNWNGCPWLSLKDLCTKDILQSKWKLCIKIEVTEWLKQRNLIYTFCIFNFTVLIP